MHNLTSHRLVFILAAPLCAGCLLAADLASVHRKNPAGSDTGGPLAAPVLGYVAQPAPLELRAILGVPGSAVFSDPLVLPKNSTNLHLSPGQDYALVERASEDPILLPLGASQALPATLTGAIQKADIAVFSPRGQAALLYSAPMARMQVIGGLPQTPQILRDWDTSAFLEQPVDAALSDDGGSVLLTSSLAVYQVLPAGAPRQLLSVEGPAALTFLPNSAQAAIADRGAGSVFLWHDTLLATQLAGGLSGAGEMRPSSDGLGLWLTQPAGNSVWWLGVKTSELRAFNVPVSPAKLQGLAIRDMFLLASDAGQPAWILFQQGSDTLTTFVPAAPRKRIAPPMLGGGK
jgi:hypothetical protein